MFPSIMQSDVNKYSVLIKYDKPCIKWQIYYNWHLLTKVDEGIQVKVYEAKLKSEQLRCKIMPCQLSSF